MLSVDTDNGQSNQQTIGYKSYPILPDHIINMTKSIKGRLSNSKTSASRHSKRKRREGTKATQKNVGANTKNLVLQIKKVLKRVADNIGQFPIDLKKQLKKKTNIKILRSCFQHEAFRERMIQLYKSSELLQMFYKGRLEHKNFANLLFYLNRLINGFYAPEIVVEGFWTMEVQIQRDPPAFPRVPDSVGVVNPDAADEVNPDPVNPAGPADPESEGEYTLQDGDYESSEQHDNAEDYDGKGLLTTQIENTIQKEKNKEINDLIF